MCIQPILVVEYVLPFHCFDHTTSTSIRCNFIGCPHRHIAAGCGFRAIGRGLGEVIALDLRDSARCHDTGYSLVYTHLIHDEAPRLFHLPTPNASGRK